ncbi:MAG: glutamine--fructose-6-phosphate transaminase (isomerizing), partial [candidate division WOR-3 bacterium]
MCGIVGYLGNKDATSVILIGLERLEYRGYDSCGIASTNGSKIEVRKTVGRLPQLRALLATNPLPSGAAIGHTRWATHGSVTERNAHPFVDCTGSLALVHNGVVENYEEIRRRLKKRRHHFSSDTDTEVILHLIEDHYRARNTGKNGLVGAVLAAARELRGSFAIGVISKDEPDMLIGVRRGSPLVVGFDGCECVLASDLLAMIGIARSVVTLEDQQVCLVRRDGIEVRDFGGHRKDVKPSSLELQARAISRGRYRHFMRKEIFEQPGVLAHNLEQRLQNHEIILGSDFRLYPSDIRRLRQIVVQACGTSYHAGLVGQIYFEEFSRLPTRVEISSELRSRKLLCDRGTLLVSISQSGETADTLAALRLGIRSGVDTLSLVNVKRSSIDRESRSVIHLHAGPEIGV